MDVAALSQDRLAALEEKYASWDWRYGKTPAFDVELYQRFDWGEVTLLLSAAGGRITGAHCYSDAMDEAFIARIAPALTGAPFVAEEMAARIAALGGPQGQALAAYLRGAAL